MKKKILFINSLYEPYVLGGAEIIFKEQVELFHKHNYDVAVLTTQDKNTKIIEENINGIDIYRLPIKNIYWHYSKKPQSKILKFLWHYIDRDNKLMGINAKKMIKKIEPDLVVCHNITGFSVSLIASIKSLKLPLVQVLHDQYYICANSNMSKNGQVCETQCLSCNLLRKKHIEKTNLIDGVVGVSNYVLEKFTKYGYFKESKTYVVHNARELPKIENRKYWNGKRSLNIGYIGGIVESKGIFMLVEEFKKLNINATLTIAGKGSLEDENKLKSIIKDFEKITFIGYTDSQEFYQMIDVTIMPSLWADTFPGVAYESCANHVPVIASNLGGLPEIIKDEVNGLLFDPNKENDLIAKINFLYNDETYLNELSVSARESVSKFLSVDRMFKEYESIMRGFL